MDVKSWMVNYFILAEKSLCITEDMLFLSTFHQSSLFSGKMQKARLVPVG